MESKKLNSEKKLTEKYLLGYRNKNPLIRYYFNKIMDEAIKIANLKEDELILDFGCGTQELKRKLLNRKVIGFDIEKEYTDIEDYTKLKPDIVFCLAVLEYLTKEGIEETLQNFKKMNRHMRIVTLVPKQHFLAKIALIILKRDFSWSAHKMPIKDVYKVLDKYLIKLREKTILTEAKISLWKFR